VTAFCRTGSDFLNNPELAQNYKPLSESQKLRKVIMELIETEKVYVKVSQIEFKVTGNKYDG